MNRYETNTQGTSPALSAILNKFATMPMSAFDETRQKKLDAFPFGIIPVETFLMFPNSKGYLRYNVKAITTNPTIKSLMSSMSIELRTYKVKLSDLWEGWNNFITRGRSGKVNLQIPTLDFIHADGKNTALPYNPAHYLNIAPAVKWKNDFSIEGNQGVQDTSGTSYDDTGLLGSSFVLASSNAYKAGVNALPFVAYAKIAKKYQNANLLQNNPSWYPENENHDLILPYDCTHASNASYDKPTLKFGDSYTAPDGTTTIADTLQPSNDYKSFPWLNVLYYKMRKGNYFVSSSPFPDLLRGDIPTLDALSAELNSDVIDVTGSLAGALDFSNSVGGSYDNTSVFSSTSNNTFANINSSKNSSIVSALNKGIVTLTDGRTWKLNDKTVKGISFSMNQWRKLAALTVFRERMARTDGSYNEMIQAQFNYNPNWHEHDVVYCGGSHQPIVFDSVTSSVDTASSPLGTIAGNAFSDSSSNEIVVTSDDFSLFMTVLTITPDDYYSQGIDRMWSELIQSEQYFPILNNLEPQAIKNKELFISGNDSDDEDVFSYQELFAHFKSRQNQVSGLMALPISKVGDIGAYILNRLLTTTPQFNNNFVTGKLTDNEKLVFSGLEQAQFALDIISQFKYVAPMPAVTQPSDMGLSY